MAVNGLYKNEEVCREECTNNAVYTKRDLAAWVGGMYLNEDFIPSRRKGKVVV